MSLREWKIGGANVWGWITYDPELDLIYHGTGNPGPWNPDVRPGANKWSVTQFARRPLNGEAVWAYQIIDHDQHDYDGINEQIVVDLDWHGTKRKVLLRPERNGYVYVIDRATGEVLSAGDIGLPLGPTGTAARPCAGARSWGPTRGCAHGTAPPAKLSKT